MEECELGNPCGFMIRLALWTGMRRGEIFKLQWDHVSEDHIQLVHPKGGKSKFIPLNPEARLVLEETPRITDSSLVFPGRNGD